MEGYTPQIRGGHNGSGVPGFLWVLGFIGVLMFMIFLEFCDVYVCF